MRSGIEQRKHWFSDVVFATQFQHSIRQTILPEKMEREVTVLLNQCRNLDGGVLVEGESGEELEASRPLP